MDKYDESRFGYFRGKTKVELQQLKKVLENDIEYSQKLIEDRGTNSNFITELYNDIKFDREKIEYIDGLLESGINKRSRTR